ncbi:MAG: multifunctional CCA addition/repair protein [Cellvibrionales bacterium]|nr:multifunctional CCA addition/repair protein [Porticoccaceae bacterium]|tara:strand:+ start:3453 stop:4697 length:1245 start_codon:yes stop_codon:yes gene_type:complete
MQIYRVGGAVRDRLLNYPSSENDWVVVGASPQQLIDRGYRPVGRDFPVFIHPQSGEEYALARTERKSGHGYGGFTFYTASNITLIDDLQRRDLTINAIAEDSDGRLIDPYNGQRDLNNKILRHVSDAFLEDPLRVLRTARFAARYHHLGFSIASETMDAMRALVNSGEMEHLVAERVWRETQRALGEQTPQVYFQTLRDCGALSCILPEVDRLFGVAQRPDFHPEIDTGVHTMMALEQAAKLSDDCSVRFAVLVHDVGKGITPADVLPRHTGHEARGLPLVKTLCERLKVPNEYRKLALVVTEYHLQCHRAADLKVETLLNLLRDAGALKSSAKLEPFLLSCEADARGRLGLENRHYSSPNYLRRAQSALATVSIADLVSSGAAGDEIGRQLHNRQIARLTEFKQTNQPYNGDP